MIRSLVVVLFACVITSGTPGSNAVAALQAGPDEKGRKDIGPGPVQWRESVEKTSAQQHEIVNFLVRRLQDGSVPKDVRREAISILASSAWKPAIAALVDNVDLKISMDVIESDEDLTNLLPCRAALLKLGWEAVPAMIHKATAVPSDKQAALLAGLFSSICGVEPARALLQRERDQFDVDHAAERASIKSILDKLEKSRK